MHTVLVIMVGKMGPLGAVLNAQDVARNDLVARERQGNENGWQENGWQENGWQEK